MCPAPPAPPASPDAHYVRLEAPPTPTSEATEATTSPAATAAVLANAVMGAGILALPYAYARSGVAGGPALVAFAGLMNAFTMHLLSSVGRRVAQDKASFHAVASATLPPSLWWLADAVVCSMMALVATSYLIVFANLAQAALQHAFLARRYPYVIIAAGVCAPWAYAEKLGGILKHTSALGLILAVYVALLSIANWLDAEKFKPCIGGHHCGGRSVDNVACESGQCAFEEYPRRSRPRRPIGRAHELSVGRVCAPSVGAYDGEAPRCAPLVDIFISDASVEGDFL